MRRTETFNELDEATGTAGSALLAVESTRSRRHSARWRRSVFGKIDRTDGGYSGRLV